MQIRGSHNSRPRKIWLVHGSHTGGHASAARSLQSALEEHPNVETEIVNLAETSESKTPASTAAEVALKGGTLVNSLRRWVFDQQFKGNPIVKWVSNKYMERELDAQTAFRKRVETERPDAIISTMSASNSLLSQMKDDGLETPVHSVVTDFAAHQMWSQENIGYYYVATDQVKQDLMRFGTPGDRVQVTGIPIKTGFSEPSIPTPTAKKRLGLKPSKPHILMLGGSLGHGSFEESLQALDEIGTDFQMTAITGRNETLKESLEALPTKHDLKVEGYVTNMPEWLDAADLVVTKPGGLTCSEILAKGKPIVLQHKSSGLEARLIDRLEATGAARVVDGSDSLKSTVGSLLSSDFSREQITQSAKRVGKPDSSATIAQHILDNL